MSSVLFTNGRFYRTAWDGALACSLVVRDGTMVGSGSPKDAPSADRTIDLAGATVIPGLTDAHVHLFAIAHVHSDVGSPKATRVSMTAACGVIVHDAMPRASVPRPAAQPA